VAFIQHRPDSVVGAPKFFEFDDLHTLAERFRVGAARADKRDKGALIRPSRLEPSSQQIAPYAKSTCKTT